MVTIPELQKMKRDGRKIVGVVVYDTELARIADRAGVEIVSVGDSVGVNLWGRDDPLDVTLDEMILVARAARRGVEHALVSCDLPYGPVQESVAAAVAAGRRLREEAGVDMVKVDAAADFPEAVTALTRAGVPVWAQFGITPHTAAQYGVAYDALAEATVSPEMHTRLVSEAERLEAAGAALLDFTNSGPVVGPSVVEAVSIPVIGGLGGGPWLDGRVRLGHAAIGYAARYLDQDIETYANVARISFDALTALCEDVRAARQIKGAVKRKT